MKKIVALAMCTVALAVSTAAQGPGQEKAIRKANKPIRSQYIVVLTNEADPDGVGNEAAARFSGRLRHVYRSALRGFAVTLSEQAAATLAEDPRVLFVEEDAQFQLAQLQSNPPWGLDRIDQRALPLDQSYTYGVPQPRQVTVHVIDTGIRVSHQEFAGRAFIAGDYVDDDHDGDPSDIANDDGDPTRMDGQDCHGHGTHVAGTIGGLTAGVAKNAIIQAHRVFACDGTTTLSAILAAIDAVTEGPRPAVANMSLGGDASSALDSAVRASIASGVVYTIAAGNANIDASQTSPARVTEAITVGASAANDTRSSFSNWGPALDLFAPGSSILSASYANDTSLVTMSGTSMAAPHVAGLAAAYLERYPTATPAQVRDALVNAATPGKIIGAGTGSPNLLLYSGFLNPTNVAISLVSPNGGETLMTTAPYTIRWDVPAGAAQITKFDVLASTNNGTSYVAVTGCSNLAAAARTCSWAAPGPATTTGRVRVIATDATGQAIVATSAGTFSIVAATSSITVTAPNTAVNWGRGSTQIITWKHNLGGNSYMKLELSRDGGMTFPETIATVLNTGTSTGYYYWTVTGPVSAGAVVRVSSTTGQGSDVSNVPFTIAEPFITVAAPSSAATNWAYDTVQGIAWSSNLGPFDKVTVSLSADGTTFSPQASNLAALDRAVYITVPTLAAPTAAARVRVSWINPPAGLAAAGTNPVGFKIEPAFITVATPNGGNVWAVGTTQSVKWTSNLVKTETLDIQLSKDGGLTWTTVRAATPHDSSEAFTIDPSWITETGRIRIVWNRKPTVSDISDANFAVR